MEQGEKDDDYDVEAELERELAALDGAASLGSADFLAGLGPLTAGSATDTEDDPEDEEPASLRALQEALQRRDAFLADFEQDLQTTAQQISQRVQAGEASAPATDGTGPGGSEGHGAAGAHASRPGTASQAAEAAGSPPLDTQSLLLGGKAVQEVVKSLQRHLEANASRPSTAARPPSVTPRPRAQTPQHHLQPTDQVPGESSSHGGAGAAGAGAEEQGQLGSDDLPRGDGESGQQDQQQEGVPSADGLQEIMAEREAVLAQRMEEERARESERQEARRREEARAAQEKAEAEARAAAAAEEAARRHAEHLAALEAQARELARQQEEEAAAAAAELARMAEETKRMEELKAAQEAARAAREAEAAALQQELAAAAADSLRLKLAAQRIQRAWAAYKRSPAHAARLASALLMQSLWRGLRARREAAVLRQQAEVMTKLEAAAQQGLLGAMQEVAAQASSVGLGEEVQARMAALQAQAQAAAEKLASAAARGTALAFQSALAAAQRFAHLGPTVVEAQREWERRGAAAQAAVDAALAGGPMQEVTRALEGAAQLGWEPARLASTLEAARARDARMAADLKALASAAPFDPAAFDALAAKAAGMGLKGDVAAARAVLDRRRRQMAGALGAKAEVAVAEGAAALQAMAAEARALGLSGEAEKLDAQLQAQRSALAGRLRLAADHGAPGALEAAMEEARTWGMEEGVLAEARGALEARQARVAHELSAQAASGSLAAFKHARRAALACGLAGAVDTAQRVFEGRRAKCGLVLQAACSSLLGAAPSKMVGELAVRMSAALGLGPLDGPAPAPGAAAAAAAGVGAGIPARRVQRPGQCAAAAERLPGEMPREMAAGMAGGAMQAQAQAVWQALVATLQLGLEQAAKLALCGLQLHAPVDAAEGSQVLASVGVQRDYWGGLSLPEWRPSGAQALLEPSALASQKQQLATDTVATAGWRQLEKAADSAAADGEGEDEQEGLLEGGAVSGGWLWPVAATEPSVLAHHLAHPPQHPPELPAHSAAAAAGAHALRGAGVLASGGKGGAGPGGRPLTQALLQSIAGAGGPGALASLVRLDLGLEQLGSLEGLDAWCPNLQVLLLDANQLGSLQGMGGLRALQELGLRSNRLRGLGGLAGQHPSLRALALDDNGLEEVPCMDGAPQLRQLSLANNHLAQLLPTAAAGSTANPLAACTATLTSLSLANNRLHSLAGIGACTALTSLDVSRNQLTSLAPLSSCTALRQLAATHNAIDAWPQAVLAAMPGLRTLDLSGNAIPCLSTVPPNAAASLNSNNESQLRPQQPPLLLPPCLEVLLLQDNQISSIAPLQGAPGLARLDLSFNRLEGLGQLRAGLAPLGALMALQANDNPVALHPGYQRTIHAVLPGLRLLDHQPIPASARLAHLAAAAGRAPLLAAATLRLVRAGVLADVSGAAAAMGAAAAQAAAAAAGGGAGREAPAAGGTAATEGAADAVRAAEAAALAGEQAVAALVHAVAPWGAPHAAQPRPAPASQLLWAVDGAEGVQGSSTGAGWVSQGAGRGATAASLCRRLAATVLWQGSERAVAGQLRPQEDPGLAPVATAASNVPGQLPGLPSSGPAVQASQLDAPALWGFQRAVSQLSQAGSSQSAAAAGVGGPGGAQARAQQALASKTLWEDAAQAMGEQHRAQLGQLWRPGQGALPAGRVGAAEGSEDEEAWEEFVVRPSFAQCRLEEQSAAAARIQAAVRGRAARLALKELQSEAHQAARRRAVLTIQAVWRGHAARNGPQLAALRRERDAARSAQALLEAEARKAAAQAEARRREAAAVLIQAAARGHGVRRKLKAAVQAARFVDDDDDGLFGEGDGELDVDGMLADLEQLVGKEVASMPAPQAPAAKPGRAAAAAQSSRQAQAAPPAPAAAAVATAPPPAAAAAMAYVPEVPAHAMMAALPALSKAFAAKMGGMLPPQMQAMQAPQVQSQPPQPPPAGVSAAAAATAYGSPGPAAAAWGEAPAAGPAGGWQAGGLATLPPLQATPPQAQAPTSPGPGPGPGLGSGPPPGALRSPGPGPAGMAGLPRPPPVSVPASHYSASYAGSVAGEGSYYYPEGPESPTSASYADPNSPGSQAGAAAERRARHVARMEALMAEWGFKDMATAEAYWRRQQRQTQGAARRKLEARFRDPDARLRKLQGVVGGRPALRPEDVRRVAEHGPEVPLAKSSLQGPPSRQTKEGGGAGAGSSASASHTPHPPGHSPTGSSATAGSGHRQQLAGRQVASADAAVTPSAGAVPLSGGYGGGAGGGSTGGVGGPGGPPGYTRSSSFSGGLVLPAVGAANGPAAPLAASKHHQSPGAHHHQHGHSHRHAGGAGRVAGGGGGGMGGFRGGMGHRGGGYGAASEEGYYGGPGDHEETQSVRSMASAASEPPPVGSTSSASGSVASGSMGVGMGMHGASPGQIRKSLSLSSGGGLGLGGANGRPSGGRGVLPVLPHVAAPPMANNWVLSPSATPPGKDGGTAAVHLGGGQHRGGGWGASSPGPLEVQAMPALARRVPPAGAGVGGLQGASPGQGLPPRGGR